MRQETNNEMDLLLRRLGRRPETDVPADHLDADELSSYAENVLPPAARARYTEHLAECARCRDLVVQLSSSAGVVVAQETAKVPEPSALRKFLASLFSPMVLRYAVPALGLIIVAAIGLMVSRRQQSAQDSVAHVAGQEPAQAPGTVSQPQPSASPGESYGLVDSTKTANKRPGQSSDTESGAAPPPPNAAPVVSSINVEPSQETAAKTVEQQPEAKDATPPAKPAARSEELQKLEAEKQKNEVRVAANEPAADKAYDQTKAPERRSADISTAGSRAARGRGEATGAAAAPQSTPLFMREDSREKDKKDADTRTVAGRHFRKQGNVWVDTAYNASRGTTSLPRASERFRAFVADEPEIKRIADELDGEIIVVWKTRAYRIQ